MPGELVTFAKQEALVGPDDPFGNPRLRGN